MGDGEDGVDCVFPSPGHLIKPPCLARDGIDGHTHTHTHTHTPKNTIPVKRWNTKDVIDGHTK